MAAAAAGGGHSVSRLSNTDSSTVQNKLFRSCSLSMNGCGSGGMAAVGIRETRTLPPVSAPELAVPQLKSAIVALEAAPPLSNSGIIRLQVPIRQRTDALEWLQAQQDQDQESALLPRFFFSSRGQPQTSSTFLPLGSGQPVAAAAGGGGGGARWESLGDDDDREPVSVAGVGSAVFFHGSDPFDLDDWRSIKRFLSKDCPLIRAYGGMRFDASAAVSPEWKNFGSFFFVVPQVEFNELQESSMLALTIAWDSSLHWPWQNAMDDLKVTFHQISPRVVRLRNLDLQSVIVSFHHFPAYGTWDISVKKALEIINEKNSELIKVVLARCSRYVTDTVVDPLALLACLKAQGENAYQFLIQPPDAPAFIGNTPEQLFHRKDFHVTSEALAGTRARGLTMVEDMQIGEELLCSPKENIEFAVVRESIRHKLKIICDDVLIKPSKVLRKLPRVQHLCAQLSGKLRDEDDEFNILTSLHPSPAVCGLPTEEARQFIVDNEMFDRGMYAGPVGWFGGTGSEIAVGIRSALLGKELFIYAGAGIVQGTNPSSEWEELDLKASQFAKLFRYHQPTLLSGSKNQHNQPTVGNTIPNHLT